jgi:hypothetical protein
LADKANSIAADEFLMTSALEVSYYYDPLMREGPCMESLYNRRSIRRLVDSLAPGTRVVWIANGTLGTVQHDKTILWDNGHHMTHKQMNDSHALLIYSEAEKRHLQETLRTRLGCVQRGCTLVQWDATTCKEQLPERLCPLAVISEPATSPDLGRRRRHPKTIQIDAA